MFQFVEGKFLADVAVYVIEEGRGNFTLVIWDVRCVTLSSSALKNINSTSHSLEQ